MQQAESSVTDFSISPRLRAQIAKAVPLDQYPGKSCVIYLDGRREKRTAWNSNAASADRALGVVRRRYGNGIIYVD